MGSRSVPLSLLFLLLTAAGGCGSSNSQPVAPAPGSAPSDTSNPEQQAAEENALIARIFESQRAGMEDRDHDAFISVWAPESVLVVARKKQPTPYDWQMTREELDASGRYNDSPLNRVDLTWTSPTAKIRGDRATLDVVHKIVFRDGRWVKMDERYWLRKAPEGWLIVRNRYWLLSEKMNGPERTYTDAIWDMLDRRVSDAHESNDPNELLNRLYDAHRIPEALTVARELTADSGATAADWLWRAILAEQRGYIDEATEAYQTAANLDEEYEQYQPAGGEDRQHSAIPRR